jgi:hypothetical protein
MPPGGMPGMSNGNPSAVVAAEIAFSRLARDKGQWTAFRETADKDAVMFMPQIVNAQAWLKKRPDPAQALSWSPIAVYMACDGSYAVSTGNWKQPDGTTGRFITLWRRQVNRSYKWVLDWGGGGTAVDAKRVSDVDDLIAIEGRIAECGPRGRRPDAMPTTASGKPEKPKSPKKAYEASLVRIPDPPPGNGEGQSPDGSLQWRWTSGAGNPRTLTVSMREGGALKPIVEDSLAAPAS